MNLYFMHDALRKGRPMLALLTITVLLASGQAATSFGNHGSQVQSSDKDYAIYYETLADLNFAEDAPVVCRVNAGVSGFADDHHYLHWGTGCTGDVSRGDVRLTKSGSHAAGTVVKAGDNDRGVSFSSIVGTTFLAGVGYLETDGIMGYSPGDFLYFSADGNLDAASGDIRLFTGNTNGLSSTAGTVVSAASLAELTEANDGDGIFPESTTLHGQGQFQLRVFDADGDGTFDEAFDRLYLTPSAAVQGSNGITDFPRIGDLRLSNADGQTFGSKVSSTSADYTYQMRTLEPRLVTTDADTSSLNARHLFMHFEDMGGAIGHVWQNDVTIKGGSSFGARVATANSGHGETITGNVDFASQLYWLDVDGNDAYTPGVDPVYLNRPTALNGPSDTLALSAGDVRMTPAPTGGYAAGTVVKAGDADLNAYASLAGNDGVTGAWFVLLHDIDGSDAVDLKTLTHGRVTGADGIWNAAVDGAYIAAGSTLANGDTRLKATPFLGNTVLDCDGDGSDHGDCGTALAASDPLWKTTVNGGTWTKTAAVYYDTDGSGKVNAGDIRAYHPTLAPGTVAGGDDDEGTDLFVVSDEGTNGNYVRATTNAALSDIYYDSDRSGDVTNGDTRLHHAWTAPAPGTTLDCQSATKDKDCGAAVTADSSIRVTGDDATYHSGRSEYVYYSKDARVNTGDFRFLAVGAFTAGSTVAAADADASRAAPTSGDQIYLSWCAGATSVGGPCENHPTGRLHVGDIQLITSPGTRVTAATTGFGVTLTPVGTSAVAPFDQAVLRYNLGHASSSTDDAFYLSFGTAGSRAGNGDIRLVPAIIGSTTKAAGTYVDSADAAETGTDMTRPLDLFTTGVHYVDVNGDGVYSQGDPVYLDLDGNGLDVGDIRLTTVTVAGTTYQGGTFVLSGHKDVLGFSFAASQPSWTLYFFDENRDGKINKADTVYLLPGTSVGANALDLLAVRLGGPGGSSTGGGGTTPPSSPPSSPPSTPPTTPPDDPTDPPEPDTPLEIITAANAGLRQSLTVDRQGDDNVLAWDAQDGVSGYQIWRSNSPFVLVATLSNVTSYKDEGAAANATYVVTAYVSHDGEDTGKYTDINNESVPGNPNLVGKSPDAGAEPKPKDGTTPGLPLAALLIMLGVAVLVRRRS